MAVRVKSSDIPSELLPQLARDLVIKPVTKKIYDKETRTTREVGAKSPIQFIHRDGDILHIPFSVALEMRLGPFSTDKDVRERNVALMQPHRRIPPERAMFVGDLREAQVWPMERAKEMLDKSGTCIFSMPPGFGKTACTAFQIARLGLRALVICKREYLINQWLGTFAKTTKINAFGWSTRIANNPRKHPDWDSVDVLIAMDTSVSKAPREFLDTVGFLAIDEAHMFCTPTGAPLFLCTHPRYIVACTATPKREDGMHLMINRVCGENSIALENTTPYILYRVETPFVPYTGATKNLDWTAVTESLVTCAERNRAIVRLAASRARIKLLSDGDTPHHETKRKVLIMTRSALHVEELLRLFHAEGVKSVSTMYRSQKKYRDAPILIGSMDKISTGFDEENACMDEITERIDTLIQTTSIASPSTIVQTFGRVFRSPKPEIYYFIDSLQTIEKRHWENAVMYARRSMGTTATFDITPFLDPEEPQGEDEE